MRPSNRHDGCRLGFIGNVLLVAGGHDQTCAALGAGVVKENIAIDSHGTAEVLSTAFYQPMLNDLMYESFYPCYYHAKKDMYFTFSLNHIGGILLQWYRDNFGSSEIKEAKELGTNVYELIISKAPKEPSPVMILPHFNGSGTPRCDLDSKGAILGLTMSTTRHDLVKAIIDCLAYELRINMETMQQAGIKINEIRCVGGAARSPVWLQAKADITGCQVSTLKVREAACLGAAMLAGTAIREYESLDEAVSRVVKLNNVYLPDEKLSVQYNQKYTVYKDIYYALKDINKRI